MLRPQFDVSIGVNIKLTRNLDGNQQFMGAN